MIDDNDWLIELNWLKLLENASPSTILSIEKRGELEEDNNEREYGNFAGAQTHIFSIILINKIMKIVTFSTIDLNFGSGCLFLVMWGQREKG